MTVGALGETKHGIPRTTRGNFVRGLIRKARFQLTACWESDAEARPQDYVESMSVDQPSKTQMGSGVQPPTHLIALDRCLADRIPGERLLKTVSAGC